MKSFFPITILPGLMTMVSSGAAQYGLEPLWVAAPDRAYLTAEGHLQRGLAYNRNTDHLLIVNRAGDFTINVISAVDGADVGVLDVSALTGGGNSQFVLNLIGVAEDGAIYAANLSNSTTAPHVNIYRWENESALQTLVFSGDPGNGNVQRWGDTFDVRGGGTITQILMGTRGNIAAVFNIDNGPAMVPRVITLDALPGVIGYGVSFAESNTFWGTAGGSTGGPLLHFDFDQIPARTIQNIPAPISPRGLSVLDVDPVRKLLVGLVIDTPDSVNLYDVSDVSSAPVLMDSEVWPSDNANGVYAGAVEIEGNRVFVLNNNNGIVAYELKTVPETSPEIIVDPAGMQVPFGSRATFAVAVKGATPVTYQWLHNDQPLPASNSSFLTINNVQSSNAGDYKVTVSNSVGSDTSAVARLTLVDVPPESKLIPLWNIPAGTRPYISNTGSSQRGMAYNDTTDHLLVPNRAGGLSIPILNGENGEEVGVMRTTGISGGSVSLTQMAVADDGVIYGCNLVTISGLTAFRIYRWESEQSEPTIAFADISSISPQRWGDTLDVRGAGNTTQILLGSGTGSGMGDGAVVALLTTENGTDFTVAQLLSSAPPFSASHGISFGLGNTFWATSLNTELYHMSFDPAAGTASVLHVYGAPFPLTITALDVIPWRYSDILIEGKYFVGGVSVGTPDQFLLFEVSTTDHSVVTVGEANFPSDLANNTATGAVEFGKDKVMAYDTNNGLMMFRVKGLANDFPGLLSIAKSGNQIVISWAGGGTLQSTTDLGNPNGWSQKPGAPVFNGNVYTFTLDAPTGVEFFRIAR